MKLYSYFRSSAAFRVRIALNLKGLHYDYLPVNLLKQEQKSPTYTTNNPQGLVPALETDNSEVLGQSVAIIEWLEENHAQPTLLPGDTWQRARIRSMVNSVCCDIHPLCNMAVTNYLKQHFGAGQEEALNWYTTWMHRSFRAIEQELAKNNATYSFGETPCMADLFLAPQVYNARRFDIPLADFPQLTRVVDNCMQLAAFADAAPEAQPDSTLSS